MAWLTTDVNSGAGFPPLHAIVDPAASLRAGFRPVELARAFLDGGAPCIQIRAKQMPSGPFLALCDSVVAMAAASGALVIVNDRADLALIARAGGVHVGQDDLPPAEARRLLGPRAVVGFSTHTMAQLEDAARQPVDYIAVGPVFGTRTKDTGYAAVGLELVSTAARLVGRIPLVGIGGITLENARSVIDAGAAAVAVIGDLLAGDDPAARTREFLQALPQHRI